ncbi:MAG: peptidoglycan-binding protein [Eubacteriales bacterium]|nr:peptidoglycan-binding protein [Eubacteriales bacterium]
MENVKQDKKLLRTVRGAGFRRVRTVVFILIGTAVVAFAVIPLIFDSIHPIAPYQDVFLPIQEASLPQADDTVPAAPPETPAMQEAAIQAVAVSPETPAVRTLQPGDVDPLVAQVQTRLMELGYMDGDEPTEKFGEQTQNALQRFQRTHYMAQTGIADALTQSILFSSEARTYSLEKGNSGNDVRKLQYQLSDLGYYTDKTNGYFGVATVRALSAFQTKNKLNADGIASANTLDVLYSSKARPKIDPTPTPKTTKTPKPAKTPKPGSSSAWTAPPETQRPSSGGSSAITQVGSGLDVFLSVALAQEGKPYVYSNEGPDSYDCSGLVYYSLRSVGINVGRLSAKHFANVDTWQTVPTKDYLAPGDLLFFTNSSGAGAIGHTGIYLGNNKFIHASSSAGRVVISTWSDWCSTNFQWGKRIF